MCKNSKFDAKIQNFTQHEAISEVKRQKFAKHAKNSKLDENSKFHST